MTQVRSQLAESVGADGETVTYCVVQTTWGWCGLATRGAGLWRSTLPTDTAEEASAALGLRVNLGADRGTIATGRASRGPILTDASRWLEQYFAGSPPELPIPLDLGGVTAFASVVLRACSRIPWGSVVTYGELARSVGRPKSARPVGQVMRHNLLPLFVPCHRVVGAGGTLTGFGGGLDLKRRLLELEGLPCKKVMVVLREKGLPAGPLGEASGARYASGMAASGKEARLT